MILPRSYPTAEVERPLRPSISIDSSWKNYISLCFACPGTRDVGKGGDLWPVVKRDFSSGSLEFRIPQKSAEKSSPPKNPMETPGCLPPFCLPIWGCHPLDPPSTCPAPRFADQGEKCRELSLSMTLRLADLLPLQDVENVLPWGAMGSWGCAIPGLVWKTLAIFGGKTQKGAKTQPVEEDGWGINPGKR